MVIIGIDFGDRRIGIASTSGLLATGVCTLKVEGINDAVEKCAAKISDLKGTLIVLGLPKNMDGTEGFRSERTRRFSDMLKEKTGLEIVLVDERLTTAQAYTYMNITDYSSKKRKGAIDTLSAQIILQSYLDSAH